jgi:endonuclease I
LCKNCRFKTWVNNPTEPKNKKTQPPHGRGSAINKLECIYTGRIVTGYTNRSDLFSVNSINAEHTFPQGKFNSSTPMVSDMHHLFPTDEDANNSRSSYPFGVASTPYIADAKNTPSHLGSNFLYEPRDVQKGATARAMLYFVIRYQDYQNFFAPQEAILKTWNKAFAPTGVDKKRNDDIQARQLNRNPFVDYPQLADRITNFVANSVAPNSYELYKQPYINYGTVTPGTYTFNYVFVNNGNQTMFISNPNLSNPAILSFATGSGSSFTIAPGEAYTLKVNLALASATDSVMEALTFNTNPGNSVVNIPIYANKTKIAAPLAAGKNIETAAFSLYPNPVTEELTIARGNQFGKGEYQLEILDALGRTVRKATGTADITTLNVSDLKRGAYFLRVQAGTSVHTSKFMKL